MRRASVWGLTLLLSAVVCLVVALVWAPARWLAWGVSQASQGRVQLSHTQGTVWQGQGLLSLGGGAGTQGQLSLPSPLTWSLKTVGPWHEPGLQLQLGSACCTTAPITATVRRSQGQWQLSIPGFDSRWPLAWLQGLGTPWNSMALQGPLQLSSPGVVLRSGASATWQGQISALVPSLSTALSPLPSVGSYQFTLGQAAAMPLSQGLALQAQSPSGTLQISGAGRWWPHGALTFEGQAQAVGPQAAQVSTLLNLLGQRRETGVALQWRLGQVPNPSSQ